MSKVQTFLGLLDKGPDNALLRYSLGNAYFAEKQYEHAIEHLATAVEQDKNYSAAWKLLGRCQYEAAQYDDAVETYQRGIKVSAEKGDVQAEREMTVFLKRAQKKLAEN